MKKRTKGQQKQAMKRLVRNIERKLMGKPRFGESLWAQVIRTQSGVYLRKIGDVDGYGFIKS